MFSELSGHSDISYNVLQASRTTSPPPTKKVSMKKEPAEPIPPPKLPSGGAAKGWKPFKLLI